MLEALQQEEYKDERAHVRMMDDDEEDFVVHQAEPGSCFAVVECPPARVVPPATLPLLHSY